MLTTQIATMGKGALRQACRANGVSYAGLNVSGMREALAPFASDAVAATQQTDAVLVEKETAPVVQVPDTAPVVQVPEGAVAPRRTSKGVKIEKDRPMSNGVKMPSAGSVCRGVWDYLQAQVDAGTPPTSKSVRAHAVAQGWNLNNASIEFYNWRKFKGITGRSVA